MSTTTTTKHPSNFITLRCPTGALFIDPSMILAVVALRAYSNIEESVKSQVWVRHEVDSFNAVESAEEVLEIIAKHSESLSLWYAVLGDVETSS
jgi:hypothetical protein